MACLKKCFEMKWWAFKNRIQRSTPGSCSFLCHWGWKVTRLHYADRTAWLWFCRLHNGWECQQSHHGCAGSFPKWQMWHGNRMTCKPHWCSYLWRCYCTRNLQQVLTSPQDIGEALGSVLPLGGLAEPHFQEQSEIGERGNLWSDLKAKYGFTRFSFHLQMKTLGNHTSPELQLSSEWYTWQVHNQKQQSYLGNSDNKKGCKDIVLNLRVNKCPEQRSSSQTNQLHNHQHWPPRRGPSLFPSMLERCLLCCDLLGQSFRS